MVNVWRITEESYLRLCNVRSDNAVFKIACRKYVWIEYCSYSVAPISTDCKYPQHVVKICMNIVNEQNFVFLFLNLKLAFSSVVKMSRLFIPAMFRNSKLWSIRFNPIRE